MSHASDCLPSQPPSSPSSLFIILNAGLRGTEEAAPGHRAVTGRTRAIPLVDDCLLNSYYVLDPVLGIGETTQNGAKKLCV